MVFARSGDIDFIQKVIHSKLNGFVHSTFKRTVNIQCLEDGELYTIACNEIDNGPNTLIVDLAVFEDINVLDKVHSVNNIISIGNKMSITIDKAKKWESILPTYHANTGVLKNNIKIMKQYIDIHGKSGGIKSNTVNESPFEQEMSKMLQERKGLLVNELSNKRLHEAIPHAVSLLGLGPGLTPSGDDFLVGLFTSFQLKNSPFANYQWFFEEIERVAKTATNEISYIAIKKASVGKIRESIIVLVNALFEENEEQLILSLKKVLNIGSSSGTDIALGILTGLEINIKIGGSL
ncbi:DUF2877 domain-containing protein [Psychrobacillus sp. NPDC058041]|uniref:DUF2877 domain-containing protein n=1 Tax=Psychrobacillus sp. NPDC058041 TaxID=3346310 RepID=UPI0036DA5074